MESAPKIIMTPGRKKAPLKTPTATYMTQAPGPQKQEYKPLTQPVPRETLIIEKQWDPIGYSALLPNAQSPLRIDTVSAALLDDVFRNNRMDSLLTLYPKDEMHYMKLSNDKRLHSVTHH